MASPMITFPSMSTLAGRSRAVTVRRPLSVSASSGSSAHAVTPRATAPGACGVAELIEAKGTSLVGVEISVASPAAGAARPLKQITIDLQGRADASLHEVLALLDIIKLRLVEGEFAGAGVGAGGTYRFEADFTSTSQHLS